MLDQASDEQHRRSQAVRAGLAMQRKAVEAARAKQAREAQQAKKEEAKKEEAKPEAKPEAKSEAPAAASKVLASQMAPSWVMPMLAACGLVASLSGVAYERQ